MHTFLKMPVSALLCLGVWAPVGAQQPAYQFNGASMGDRLGSAVSWAGDVDGDGFDDVVVGVPFEDEVGLDAGQVLVMSGADASVLFTFDGAARGDRLGSAVGGAGDVNGDGFQDVIAGAPAADNNGTSSGMARVYSGADGAVLYSIDGDNANDEYGTAVSTAGDVNDDGYDDFVVGAPFDDNNGPASGSARVYSGRDGSVLYTFDGDSSADVLGWSVGTAGDVDGDGNSDIIVGIPRDDVGGTDAGRARVFSGADGSVIHTFTGRGTADNFGWSVAPAGDVDGDGRGDVLIGAPRADRGGLNSGSVFVYAGGDGTLLYRFDGKSPDDNLGWSVSTLGDVNADGASDFIAGAPARRRNTVRVGGVTAWSGLDGAVLLSVDGSSGGDQMGWSVSGSGDINGDGYAGILVGSPMADASVLNAGSALVFSRPPFDRLVDVLTHNPSSAGGNYGLAASALGDVNADGSPDYVIGAHTDVATLGAVRVYSGADHSLLHQFIGSSLDIFFGARLGPAGDLDNDGFDDIVVGAMHEDTVAQDSGMVAVYSGQTGVQLLTVLGKQFRSHLGTAVGGVGDLNGDGVDDVFGSAGIEDPGIGPEAGVTYVFSGVDGTVLLQINGEQPREWFGWSGAPVGDVNGDGRIDFVIGAPQGQVLPVAGNGYAKVFSGADGSVIYRFDGLGSRDLFGWTTNPAGDVNADGVPDIIVGGYNHDPVGLTNAGMARVFSGADGSVLYHKDGLADGDAFGQGVGPAGDANGDGFDDFIVGAPGADPAGVLDAGSAYVYSGSDGRLLQRLDGAEAGQAFGRAVTGIGDSNGDGLGDLIVTSPAADDPMPDSGIANVYESAAESKPGRFSNFGAACAGSNANLPTLVLRGTPRLGRIFSVALRAARPNALVALNFDAIPRSIPMDINGMPGCTLLAIPLVSFSALTDSNGRTQIGALIPNSPVFVDSLTCVQWAVFDPGANPLGLVLSDGGCIQVGI